MRAARAVLVAVTLIVVACWRPVGWGRVWLGLIVGLVMLAELRDVSRTDA